MSLELEALVACDVPGGRSTNNPTPWYEELPSLIDRGLLEKVRTELEGGFRQYTWYRITEKGREYLKSKVAPVEW